MTDQVKVIEPMYFDFVKLKFLRLFIFTKPDSEDFENRRNGNFVEGTAAGVSWFWSRREYRGLEVLCYNAKGGNTLLGYAKPLAG